MTDAATFFTFFESLPSVSPTKLFESLEAFDILSSSPAALDPAEVLFESNEIPDLDPLAPTIAFFE
jgi:hypothetical protein